MGEGASVFFVPIQSGQAERSALFSYMLTKEKFLKGKGGEYRDDNKTTNSNSDCNWSAFGQWFHTVGISNYNH